MMKTQAHQYALLKLGKPLTCSFCHYTFNPDSPQIRIMYIPDPYYGPGHNHQPTCLDCWEQNKHKYIWYELSEYNPIYDNHLLFKTPKEINLSIFWGGQPTNCFLCSQSIQYRGCQNWSGQINNDLITNDPNIDIDEFKYCYQCVIDHATLSGNTRDNLIESTYQRIDIRNNFRAYPLLSYHKQ